MSKFKAEKDPNTIFDFLVINFEINFDFKPITFDFEAFEIDLFDFEITVEETTEKQSRSKKAIPKNRSKNGTNHKPCKRL